MSEADFPKFVVSWNTLQNFQTPHLHMKISTWLEDHWHARDPRLLLMAFRSSGKSTLVGLFCAWILLRHPDLRILVLAADHALARKMVRNVKRVIERHPLTAGLKPRQADQWASDQFTVNRATELRDPSMLAKGIGANVTGSRADIVICDDVEVPNTCDTAAKREDLRQRLEEIDYVLVPGGLQLYVGTPHTYCSIYAASPRTELDEDQPFLDGFERLELPLLDGAGMSRWPERFPSEMVRRIQRRSGPNKFRSQMLLQPVNIAESRLDPDLIRLYDEDLIYREGNSEANLYIGQRRMVSATCWWDPSFGSPSGGDASVIAAVFTDDQGDYWLHGMAYLTHDPALREEIDEATQLCRQAGTFARRHYVPSITLETNGLGRFLPGLLRRELARTGLHCAVVETASRQAKAQRIIEAFDAVLAARRLHAHRQVSSTPFLTEMREWSPKSRTPDDGLDAVSGCLLTEPVRLPRYPVSSRSKLYGRADWRHGGAGYTATTDFDV